MKSLIVSATAFEIEPILSQYFQYVGNGLYKSDQFNVLVTGIGLLETSYQLAKELALRDYKFVLNLGVAGSYHNGFQIGDVLEVLSEEYGDMGAEDRSGKFLPVEELGLQLPSCFSEGRITTPKRFPNLKSAAAISINQVAGTAYTIRKRIQVFAPDIETMEGLAVFRVCRDFNIPVSQIRCISNRVEPRDRSNWNLELAIQNLNQVAQMVIQKPDLLNQ